MCPSAPRVCSEPGGQRPVPWLSLDFISMYDWFHFLNFPIWLTTSRWWWFLRPAHHRRMVSPSRLAAPRWCGSLNSPSTLFHTYIPHVDYQGANFNLPERNKHMNYTFVHPNDCYQQNNRRLFGLGAVLLRQESSLNAFCGNKMCNYGE